MLQKIREAKKMKKVYTCFSTDIIHEGHMNIIREAKKYGEVIVGVLTDEQMVRFNRFPTVSFEERVQMVKDIPEVDEVVIQDEILLNLTMLFMETIGRKDLCQPLGKMHLTP